MPLLVLGLAWLAGVYSGSLAQPPVVLLLALAAAVAAGTVALARRRSDRLAGLALAVFLLGLARYEHHARTLESANLARYTGHSVAITGVVDEAPDRRARSQRLVVAVRSVEQDGQEVPAQGRALVTLPPLPERHYGDLLRLQGRLEPPPVFADFDYRAYLYRQGISAVLAFPRTSRLATDQGSPARATLIALREQLSAGLAALLPEPHAALAQGIVLGQRTAIPNDLRTAFALTGTTHLLAVSGQNLTWAAALAVLWGSRAFGRRHLLYYVAVLGALWAYALLVGLSPSVLRAVIMASMLVVAAGLGRPGGGLVTLVAAAAVMVALDPLALWDVGFQLSFLALSGVFFLAPIVDVGVWRLPGLHTIAAHAGMVRSLTAFLVMGLTATLGAALTTLPVVWSNFGSIPALALPATVCALPAFPLVMGAGGLAALFSVLYPPLATPFAWLTVAGTSWLQTVIQAWSQIPFAVLVVDRPPAAVAWLYTATLFAVMGGAHRTWQRVFWRPKVPGADFHLHTLASWLRVPGRPPLLASLILAAVILFVGWHRPDRGLHVWLLDGGGDTTLIRTPGGATMLIGGSPDPAALARALGQALPFWQRDIDLVILPDPSREHLPGLLMALERYDVRQVMEGIASASTVDYREWERRIQDRGLSRTRLRSAIVVDLGDGLTLRTLAAPQAGGLALALEGGGARALLLDRAVTRGLAAETRDLTTIGTFPVVKVAWRTGDPPISTAQLEQLRPQALITAGVPPALPPEHEDTVEVFAVAERGAIAVGWEQGAGWLRTAR